MDLLRRIIFFFLITQLFIACSDEERRPIVLPVKITVNGDVVKKYDYQIDNNRISSITVNNKYYKIDYNSKGDLHRLMSSKDTIYFYYDIEQRVSRTLLVQLQVSYVVILTYQENHFEYDNKGRLVSDKKYYKDLGSGEFVYSSERNFIYGTDGTLRMGTSSNYGTYTFSDIKNPFYLDIFYHLGHSEFYQQKLLSTNYTYFRDGVLINSVDKNVIVNEFNFPINITTNVFLNGSDYTYEETIEYASF